MKLEQITTQQKIDQLTSNNSYLTANLYELSLILAEAQSRNNQDRWDCFINNLSRICDTFATSRQRGFSMDRISQSFTDRNYSKN